MDESEGDRFFRRLSTREGQILQRPVTESADISGVGLDADIEMERPWSWAACTDQGVSCPADGLRAVVEYLVVDGEDAHALAQRQGVALREVLGWLRDHQEDFPESGPA